MLLKQTLPNAKSEIETLQSSTAKLNANNNLGNQIAHNAVLINNSEGYYAGGTVNTSQNINFQNGHQRRILYSWCRHYTYIS